jgi:hypothetical protein
MDDVLQVAVDVDIPSDVGFAKPERRLTDALLQRRASANADDERGLARPERQFPPVGKHNPKWFGERELAQCRLEHLSQHKVLS